MTRLALGALAHDPATALVVLVSKPPDPRVLPGLETALAALGKPAVVCCLGAPARTVGSVRWVETTEDAAACAAATLGGTAWAPRAFSDADAARAALARLRHEPGRPGPGLLGLYVGGTLAHEARVILDPLVGPVGSNLGEGREADSLHRVLDLGADEFTLGRAHPMLDPAARAAHVRQAGRDAQVGVLLLDLVLGRGVPPDPVGPLAAAIRDARRAAAADGRALTVIASVVGTADDPQDLRAQVATLRAGGAEVLPSSAQAARLAALWLRPGLEAALLGGAR
jgi:FdrA protein